MFRKLLVSSCILFLTFNVMFTTTATIQGNDWYDECNGDLVKSFDLSESYINEFFNKYYTGQYDTDLDSLNNGALTQKQVDALEKHILAIMSKELGHVYLSDINNELTIHFDSSKESYVVAKSSGNATIDELLLTFVGQVGDITANLYAYNLDGKVIQPEFTVNGSDVTIYVPYVYYNANTRKYLAQQLENKLEALSGKSFNVTFKSSKKSTAEKYGVSVDIQFYEPFDILSLIEGAKDSNYVSYIYNEDLPTYFNGDYLSNPSYIRVKNTSLTDLLDLLASEYGYEDNGYWERYGLYLLVREMFMNPFVVRVVCDDYTITLRAGRILDIEESDPYINSLGSASNFDLADLL